MNETIKTQLNHRSIRQFKPLALTQGKKLTFWLMLPDIRQLVTLDSPIRLSVLQMKH